MRDIILVSCMKCKSFPIKTVEEDAFCSYYISYNYFKNSPKITRSSKKGKSQVANLVHSPTDGQTDGQADRRTDDGHRVMGKKP